MARSLHELSSNTQLAVFGVLCVLTVVGAWQVLLGPELAAVEERRSHLTTLEGDVTRAQSTAARLVLVQREVRALEATVHATTAVIPDETDPQDVLRSLNELASESMIGLAGFTNKTIVTRAQYSEWPVTLALEGGYHDIGRFFDRIASTPRLISVSDLNIKTRQQSGGRGTVSATCTATTFVVRKDTVPAVAVSEVVAQIPVGTIVGTSPSGYDGGSRRDPFMSLIYSRRSTSPAPPPPRSTGLLSLSLTDIRITGILRSGQNFIAIVEGPDKSSYSARPKDRLLDAVVKSIDAQGVVFIEQSGMTGPGREIRKTLRRRAEDSR